MLAGAVCGVTLESCRTASIHRDLGVKSIRAHEILLVLSSLYVRGESQCCSLVMQTDILGKSDVVGEIISFLEPRTAARYSGLQLQCSPFH